jgi:hypothetical protein
MAERGDKVADASITWPESPVEVPFGALTLTARVDDQEPERRKIIFDPLPRVAGIDTSSDPLTEVRSDIYLLSGRRRRAWWESTSLGRSNERRRHQNVGRRQLHVLRSTWTILLVRSIIVIEKGIWRTTTVAALPLFSPPST